MQWYWCQEHERAESAGEACGQDRRLGPYDSKEAAENWRTRHQAREERWEEQDEEWSSWGVDAADADTDDTGADDTPATGDQD